MDAFREHMGSQTWLQAVWCAHIDCTAEEVFQMVLQGAQPQEPDWTVKLDQQIHVARLCRFITRDGTKQDERLDPELLPQDISMVAEGTHDVITFHVAPWLSQVVKNGDRVDWHYVDRNLVLHGVMS